MVHELQDADQQAAEVLVTVRLLIGAVLAPNTDMSVPGLAAATGLSVETVRQVMGSVTYKNMLQGEASQLLHHAMVRGLRKMDSIVHGDKVGDANRINAYRAIVGTYAVIKAAQAKDAVDADLDKFLESFGKKKIEVTPT